MLPEELQPEYIEKQRRIYKAAVKNNQQART